MCGQFLVRTLKVASGVFSADGQRFRICVARHIGNAQIPESTAHALELWRREQFETVDELIGELVEKRDLAVLDARWHSHDFEASATGLDELRALERPDHVDQAT